MVKKDKPVKYYTNFTKNAFKNLNFNFIGNRRKGYMFSAALTVIGLIVMFTSGFNFGVDFKGGRTYTVRFEQAIDEIIPIISTTAKPLTGPVPKLARMMAIINVVKLPSMIAE